MGKKPRTCNRLTMDQTLKVYSTICERFDELKEKQIYPATFAEMLAKEFGFEVTKQNVMTIAESQSKVWWEDFPVAKNNWYVSVEKRVGELVSRMNELQRQNALLQKQVDQMQKAIAAIEDTVTLPKSEQLPTPAYQPKASAFMNGIH